MHTLTLPVGDRISGRDLVYEVGDVKQDESRARVCVNRACFCTSARKAAYVSVYV